jgi:hypothetical protein
MPDVKGAHVGRKPIAEQKVRSPDDPITALQRKTGQRNRRTCYVDPYPIRQAIQPRYFQRAEARNNSGCW